jgi:hypothetical protein
MTKDEARVAKAAQGWSSFGDNLYLRVDGPRRRRIVKVVRDGRKREFGLGALKTTSLAFARKKRGALMDQLADGLDPTAEKLKAREQAKQARSAKAKRKTFAQCAEAVFAARSAGWRTASDGRQSSASDWIRSLNRDWAPIRKLPVEDISLDDVKRCVQPFWDQGKYVSARNLLSRIELVIEHALAHGWRALDNPAAWKRFQHIAPVLPKNGKAHHPALEWKAMPAFMVKLRAIDGVTARCLEFLRSSPRPGLARRATRAATPFWLGVISEESMRSQGGSTLKRGVWSWRPRPS